jgi:hypothetical protein
VRFGPPEDAAARITSDPLSRLAPLHLHLGDLTGQQCRSYCEFLGASCGPPLPCVTQLCPQKGQKGDTTTKALWSCACAGAGGTIKEFPANPELCGRMASANAPTRPAAPCPPPRLLRSPPPP